MSKPFRNVKIKQLAILTLAGLINAVGITLFLSPVNILDSGISGTSMLLEKVTPNYLSLSLFLVVINVPLFIYGYKKQGGLFTFYAIYSVLMYSLFAFIINNFLGLDLTKSPFANNDLVLCSVFGGLISGIGSGLAIRGGGAMDGIEVLAVIFAKSLGITVGTFVMIYNVLLYVACGIVFSSWVLPLYSIIAYAVAIKAVDFLVDGIDRAKSSTIITDKADEVCEKLSLEFGCGITVLDAKGYYSGSQKTMIYIVLNRFQIPKMKRLVHEIDSSAYISITDIADVVKAK